jgi:hypothetical protein
MSRVVIVLVSVLCSSVALAETGTTLPTQAEPASVASFMDTRLSFTCTHEALFRDPTILPSAPGFHCGRPNSLGVLFFDNYDTRFSGFETLSHLALYKRSTDERHWDLEGAFVVRINEISEENIRLSDGGSFIRAAYWLDPARNNPNTVALVAFPVSSDRMRLGYSYRISWGGSAEFFKPNPDIPYSSGKNSDSVPGAKLQFDSERGYFYIGVKTSSLLDPEINEKRSVISYLGGMGLDVTPRLRIEANGGHFDRGKNEAESVLGEPVRLSGASVQLALHDGMAVGSSIDYKLYRNDPTSIARLFRREQYPGGLSWLVSTEGTVLLQTLADADKTGSTTIQKAYAGDVNVRVKYDRTRLKLDVMVRDLAYILHSVPSLPSYFDFHSSYTSTPEWLASVGVDQYFPGPRLTLGANVGGNLPATLETPVGQSGVPGNLIQTSTTAVVRNESSLSVLPEGKSVALVWAIKASARLDFDDSFAALADVYYQYDPNTVRYDRESEDATFSKAEFADFSQLGFNVTLQSRF